MTFLPRLSADLRRFVWIAALGFLLGVWLELTFPGIRDVLK